MAYKILIVDDEKAIADILEFNLLKEGYATFVAYDGEAGLALFKSAKPDLVLLDIMMPKMDGLTVCKAIRAESNVPIIMLTARAEEVDKVVGLEFGADDYVTKPFGVREMMARVKANLRRVVLDLEQPTAMQMLKFGTLTINKDRYEASKGDRMLELTVREYELLEYLARQKNQIFTREQLLEHVWGFEYFGDVRTVDVTIRRLREKLEDDPSKPLYIQTKRGVGYYFNSNGEQ